MGEVARAFARSVPTLNAGLVETGLLAREQLGSTGLGAGFALPHARIEGLVSYAGLLVRLGKPIDFDAIDGKPVGLVFVLLIPPEGTVPHVAALAAISRRFRDADFVARLKKAKSAGEAYGVMTES
jgi:PTS system nitrogen regulatory IIA component